MLHETNNKKITVEDTTVDFQSVYREEYFPQDLLDGLDNISCPVMIVCGEKDNANKKAAKELATLLKNARLEIVSGAGHEVNVEAPDKLGKLLRSI